MVGTDFVYFERLRGTVNMSLLNELIIRSLIVSFQNAKASYDFSSNDPYPYPRYTDDWFNR